MSQLLFFYFETLLEIYIFNINICLLSMQILGVEMLSVLHRVLLTRESLDIQFSAMRVVRQIVKAAQESLDTKKAATAK